MKPRHQLPIIADSFIPQWLVYPTLASALWVARHSAVGRARAADRTLLIEQHFISSDEPENVSCSFVEKVEIEVIIRKALGKVSKTVDLYLKPLSLNLCVLHFRLHLKAGENAERSLDDGIEKVKGQHGHHGKKQNGAKVQSVVQSYLHHLKHGCFRIWATELEPAALVLTGRAS